MATHSSILAWKILRTEEPGTYSPWGRKKLDMTEQLTHTHTHTHTHTFPKINCTARPPGPHRASSIPPSFCALRTSSHHTSSSLYLHVNMLEGGAHAARRIYFKPCLS